MKLSHYVRLLGYQPLVTLLFLSAGAWIAWSAIARSASYDVVFLGFFANGPFVCLLTGMALPFILNTSFTGIKDTRFVMVEAELEFFFTRAVSRRALFYSRATRYLLVCLFPVMIGWGYACARPQIRMQLSFVPRKRAGMEQFYLAHFPGSYVQPGVTDAKNNAFAYVVLPHGRMEQSFCAAVWVGLTALLYQLFVFIFWRKRFAALIVFLFFVFVPNFWLLWLGSSLLSAATPFTPTAYETSLGWMNLHVPLTLLLLGLLAIITQIYSCHHYINTEITS